MNIHENRLEVTVDTINPLDFELTIWLSYIDSQLDLVLGDSE